MVAAALDNRLETEMEIKDNLADQPFVSVSLLYLCLVFLSLSELSV